MPLVAPVTRATLPLRSVIAAAVVRLRAAAALLQELRCCLRPFGVQLRGGEGVWMQKRGCEIT